MSQLNITRNTFLEKEELTRLQQFMMNNITRKLFVANTTSFGVVQSDFTSLTPLDFQVQAGTNPGTIKIANESTALDSAGNLITQVPIDNIEVTDGVVAYWVKILYNSTSTEAGTVSIDAVGNLTGTGTFFSQVLRGQSTDVPTKIKFVNTIDDSQIGITNDGIYEVVQVTGDNAAIIIGATSVFTPQSAMKYVVIGATPVSESVSEEQKNGLYLYDSCKIELIQESIANTMPVIGYIAGLQFYLARVVNTSGTLVITDKRIDWWEFNIRGLQYKLDKAANLSDLENIVTARANLQVYSVDEVLALLAAIPNRALYSGRYFIGDVSVSTSYMITFPSIGTSNYYISGSIISLGTPDNDTSVLWTIIDSSRTNTSFSIYVRQSAEGGNRTQNIAFEFIILKK